MFSGSRGVYPRQAREFGTIPNVSEYERKQTRARGNQLDTRRLHRVLLSLRELVIGRNARLTNQTQEGLHRVLLSLHELVIDRNARLTSQTQEGLHRVLLSTLHDAHAT